jgi:hypothetical protein
MNKPILALLIGITAALLIGALAMPPSSKESIKSSWRRINSDAGQACFDFELKQLKDPYSAILDSYTTDSQNENIIYIKYHAKNGYGAYGPGEAVCHVYSGEVNAELTNMRRNNIAGKERLEKMDSHIRCQKNRNALMLAGNSIEAEKINCKLLENY